MDAIFVKPHPDWPLRERMVHRFENALCRLRLHDWNEWHLSKLWGDYTRMCRHCTTTQHRELTKGKSD